MPLNWAYIHCQTYRAIDTSTRKISQTIKYKSPEGVYAGVAFSPDGTHAYASGGGEKIHVYSISGGTLTAGTPIQLPAKNPAGQSVNMYPAGSAVAPGGKRPERCSARSRSDTARRSWRNDWPCSSATVTS